MLASDRGGIARDFLSRSDRGGRPMQRGAAGSIPPTNGAARVELHALAKRRSPDLPLRPDPASAGAPLEWGISCSVNSAVAHAWADGRTSGVQVAQNGAG